MFSPQPALPRRQMPLMSSVAVGDLARRPRAMKSQVGASGMVSAGLLEQVLAVHEHRALAVERRGVELAVDGQAAADRRQQVVDVVVGAEASSGTSQPCLPQIGTS